MTPIAHFHDSRGTGLVNCVAALEAGATWFDASFGGVGGHPAKVKYGGGFTGNVCTEDLASLLESMGVSTGLDLDRVGRPQRCKHHRHETVVAHIVAQAENAIE